MSRVIKLKGQKCSVCHDFLAQYLQVTPKVQLLGRDKVYFRFLCRGCYKELVK